ncbi:MAG: cysteine synthase family protein [Acidobacteriota bacterium]
MHAPALDLIGRSPLVHLPRLSPKPGIEIFAKLEGQNPSGSVKDRIASGLVAAAEARGDLKPGDTIVEATTGNTGIALAMVSRQKGYKACTILPRGVAPSIKDLLELLGVDIIWCEPSAGMKGCIDRAQRLAAERGYYPLSQFGNPENVEIHYRTTGAEIVAAIPDVTVFVAGIGTGGTIMGVGRRLREINPSVRIIGVEPRVGDHLQGLRSLDEGYIPPLLDLGSLHGRYMVNSAQALEAARRVAAREGLIVGVSSGATLHAAMRVAETMERGNIVVMFSDSGWKYLPAHPWEAARAGDASLDDVHWW